MGPLFMIIKWLGIGGTLIPTLLDYKHYVDHNKLENSERWEYQTTWPASWETYMQVRKQQLEPDI